MSCSLIAISYKYIRKSLIWPKTSMQCSFRHSKRTCSLDVLVILSNQVNMGIIKKIILGHLQKSALNLNDIKMQLIHYRQMQINNKKKYFIHISVFYWIMKNTWFKGEARTQHAFTFRTALAVSIYGNHSLDAYHGWSTEHCLYVRYCQTAATTDLFEQSALQNIPMGRKLWNLRSTLSSTLY